MTNNTKRGIRLSLFSFILVLAFCSIGMATAATTVEIVPTTQTVDPGDPFTVRIDITPDTAVGGAQASLTFDPSLVTVDTGGVTTGGMFPGLLSGTVDNVAGTITGMAGYFTGEATTTTAGTFVEISFTADAVNTGTSPLDLFDVKVTDGAGVEVPSDPKDGTVRVGSDTLTLVEIVPTTQTVNPGDSFTARIDITPDTAVGGAQASLTFDPSLVTVDTGGVTTGGMFPGLLSGTVDNVAGTITGMAGYFTGEATTTTAGTFVEISFTADAVNTGTSPLDLFDVKVTDGAGVEVPSDPKDGTVEVSPLTLNTYYRDADGDTYGNPDDTIEAESAPAGYVEDNTDCDDTNAAVNPGATEICNSIDDDCDNLVDDADPDCVGMTTYYQDADGDNYGNSAVSIDACAQPTGYVTDDTDCDDTNVAVNPGATEICNSIDDDCDTLVDDADPDCVGMTTYYQDADGDNYGNPVVSIDACAQPIGYVTDNTDCDDTNAAVNPGATEVCNGIDDNCDGTVDEGFTMNTYYGDADGDTYGDPANTTEACAAPPGYVENNTDCDDTNAAVNPGATEVCDGVDNDCDTLVDEDVMTTYYGDADGDTYGDPANTTEACAAPPGYVEDNTDCDDTNAAVNPGAAEVPDDGIDNNCNGVVDEDFCLDLDAGWNLVSIPKMVNGSIDAEIVFNIGPTELCEYYDACASPPRWLTLGEIYVDPTRGYLVSKDSPEMLCLNFADGAMFPSAQPVCEGEFNMIGFPSMDGMSVNDFKTATGLEFSMIMQWDSGYYSTGSMTAGRGYLIWPTADGSMPGMLT